MSTVFPTGFSTLASVTGTTKVLADDGSNNGVATVDQILGVGDPRVPTSGNTVGNVPAFTSTGGQLGASPISVSGSNVGVGTASPGAKLDVVNNATELPEIRFSYSGDGNSYHTKIVSGSWGYGSASQYMQFSLKNGSGTVSPLTLLASGNVGIGTTAPIDRLNVEGGGVVAQSLSAVGSPSIYSLGGGLEGCYYSGVARLFGYADNYGNAAPLSLNQNGGNVGIGTTSPTVGYNLDVIGDVRCNALTQYSDETRKDKVSDLSAVALPFLKALVTAGADMAFTWKSKDAETKTVTRDVPVMQTVDRTRVEIQNVNGTWREVTVTDTVTEPVTEEQTYIALDGSTKTHLVPVMQTVTETETITPAMESGTRVHWGLSAQKTKAAADALGISFGGYKDSAIKDPLRPSVKGLDYIELIPALVVALVQVTNDFEAYKAAHP